MREEENLDRGDFTLPGEAGHEGLTLELAEKWGADTIRDSDGTELSPEIIEAGYDIYSTVCLVRGDNEWAKQHRNRLQQNYLMSFPVVAEGERLCIELLKGYFTEQFEVNYESDPKRWWQVFDRTSGEEVPKSHWEVDPANGTVTIRQTEPCHSYTVNFFAYRIWEAISMYNHITNGWADRDHLMPVDPIYPETQEHILEWLEKWLVEHQHTRVVRFTSMFYNFSWFWGSDAERHRYHYSDWGDYAMTVSPRSLELFEQERGYPLESEVFINGGQYNCTHNAPTARYLDYIRFMHGFVVDFGRKCVELAHQHGKKAYVFYDDHWIGVEPYSPRFREFGFDGIIKCVFNAFEARKCAGVEGVETHELRLHPYLFPTGLKGEPTFKEGGNPTLDAKEFWIDTRRALLRAPVDRIGLGGYLSLVEPFPDFMDYIQGLAREFRLLKSFHSDDTPHSSPFKVAILTSWGRLRSWICSGHFAHGLELNELIESLAGLPLEVMFISFDDLVEKGIPDGVKTVINCGREGSSWSGGHYWKDERVVEILTRFVADGGSLVGIAEPTATRGGSRFFQMADVLGLDRNTGSRLGHIEYDWRPEPEHFITKDLDGQPDFGKDVDGIFTLDGQTRVLRERDGSPTIAIREFGKGRCVYLSGYRFTPGNTRLIHRAIYWAAGHEAEFEKWTCTNVQTECAWFPGNRRLVVINNSGEQQKTNVFDEAGGTRTVEVAPHGIEILSL